MSTVLDDDLWELEASQVATRMRRRGITYVVMALASFLVWLALMAVEFLLPAGSLFSVLLGWLGDVPSALGATIWIALLIGHLVEEEKRQQLVEKERATRAREARIRQERVEREEREHRWQVEREERQERRKQEALKGAENAHQALLRSPEDLARMHHFQELLDRENGYERKSDS